jgi:hypothetical protein
MRILQGSKWNGKAIIFLSYVERIKVIAIAANLLTYSNQIQTSPKRLDKSRLAMNYDIYQLKATVCPSGMMQRILVFNKA